MLALAIINVAATITSVALYVSPFPDFRRIHANKSTGEVRILPVLMLCCNSIMWALYGLVSGIYFPVMSINVFGTITTVAFASVFYRWSTERAALKKMASITGVGALAVVAFTVLAEASVIPMASSQVALVLGYGAVAVNICLYAAPLQTTKTVVQTKSAASIPMTMCVVNLINGTLWLSYALLSHNMFVLAPNSLGVVLCIVQVTLGIKYRPKADAQVVESVQEAQSVQVIVEVDKIQAVDAQKTLSRARSEMALAVTCAEAVAIELARSKSYRFAGTPQTA